MTTYEVLVFPTYPGSPYTKPWRTNYLFIAMLYAYWRAAWNPEARIVHIPSGRHVVIL